MTRTYVIHLRSRGHHGPVPICRPSVARYSMVTTTSNPKDVTCRHCLALMERMAA